MDTKPIKSYNLNDTNLVALKKSLAAILARRAVVMQQPFWHGKYRFNYASSIELCEEVNGAVRAALNLTDRVELIVAIQSIIDDYQAALDKDAQEFKSFFGFSANTPTYQLKKELESITQAFITQAEQPQIALRFADMRTAKSYCKLGTQKMFRKDYVGALADYTQAITLNPNAALVYHKRGDLKNVLQDYNGAIADYTQAVKLNPYDALAYINRGMVKEKLADYSSASADYATGLTYVDVLPADKYNNNTSRKHRIKNELKNKIASLSDQTTAVAMPMTNSASLTIEQAVKLDKKGKDKLDATEMMEPSVTEINAKITVIVAQTEANTKAIDEIKQTNAQNQLQLAACDGTINQLQRKNQTQVAETATLQAATAQQQAVGAQQLTVVQSLNTGVIDNTVELSADQQEVKRLNDKVYYLEAERQKDQIKISTLEAEKAEKQARIGELEEIVEQLGGRINRILNGVHNKILPPPAAIDAVMQQLDQTIAEVAQDQGSAAMQAGTTLKALQRYFVDNISTFYQPVRQVTVAVNDATNQLRKQAG